MAETLALHLLLVWAALALLLLLRPLLRRMAGAQAAYLAWGMVPAAALGGAWRPRLALPLYFNERFDADERAAILAHEAAHLRRHDNRSRPRPAAGAAPTH